MKINVITFSLSIHFETQVIIQKPLIKFYFTSHWSELGQISISLSLDQLEPIMKIYALSASCMRTWTLIECLHNKLEF